MIRKKILLGSKDIVEKNNVDSYVDIELLRSIQQIRPSTIVNEFNLSDQYSKERNESFKYGIYGRVKSKEVNTQDLKISVSTSDDDTLYTPNKKDAVKASKQLEFMPMQLSKDGSLGSNIFGFHNAAYYISFELDKDSVSGKTKNLILDVSGEGVRRIISLPLIIFDFEGDFVPYGAETSDINAKGEIIDIINDYPFLYDRHWIKYDLEIAKFGDVSFVGTPISILTNENAVSNRITITDSTLTATFDSKLAFPSLDGFESAEVVAKKIDIDAGTKYKSPNHLYNKIPKIYKPWLGFPNTIHEWGFFAERIANKVRGRADDPRIFTSQEIYGTTDEYYEKTHRFVLSFLKGLNLEASGLVVGNGDFINSFLHYNISVFRKDVNNTEKGEFLPNQDTTLNQIFDTAKLSWEKEEQIKPFTIDFSKATIKNEVEYFRFTLENLKNSFRGYPDDLIVRMNSENTAPKASFQKDFLSGQSINQDIDVTVTLNKPYEGNDDAILNIVVDDITTNAINYESVNIIVPSPDYVDGQTEYIQDFYLPETQIKFRKGEQQQSFKIRIYNSDLYHQAKNIRLTIKPVDDTKLGIESFDDNIFIEINHSVTARYTKYKIPGSIADGTGIFRSRIETANNKQIYRYELAKQEMLINQKQSFTPSFTFDIEIVNRGVTPVLYINSEGKLVKEAKVGEVVLKESFGDGFEGLDIILPTNAKQTDFSKNHINEKAVYLNAKYEFRIVNIQAAGGSNSNVDTFRDITIPAINAESASPATLGFLLLNADDLAVLTFPELSKSIYTLFTGVKEMHTTITEVRSGVRGRRRDIKCLDGISDTEGRTQTIPINITMPGTILLPKVTEQSNDGTKIAYRAFSNKFRKVEDLTLRCASPFSEISTNNLTGTKDFDIENATISTIPLTVYDFIPPGDL